IYIVAGVLPTTKPHNKTSNEQLPLPTANNKVQNSAKPQTSTSQSDLPIDTTTTSNSDKISLDISLEHNPISAGERQTVSLTASDPATGNTLDRVFLRLT